MFDISRSKAMKLMVCVACAHVYEMFAFVEKMQYFLQERAVYTHKMEGNILHTIKG